MSFSSFLKINRLILFLLIILIGVAFFLKYFSSQGIKNKIGRIFIYDRLNKIEQELLQQKKIANTYLDTIKKLTNNYLLEEELLISKTFGNFVKKRFNIEDKFSEEYKSLRSRWNVLEKFNDNVILTYHDGSTIYFKSSDLDRSLLDINQISTNLSNFLNNKNNNVLVGVRDTFLHEDGKLYVSILQEIEDCTRIIVVRSKMNLKNMNFEVYYEQPNDCSSRIVKIKDSWTAGGALSASWNGNIALSIGDFNSLVDAQENKNLLGKIIEINSSGKINKILALGLRNPTSLHLEKNNLFITVIGPESGDEINHINLKDNLPVNFGWPYATYGKHDFKVDFEYGKKHESKGFKEPLFYGTPNNSMTPSQLIFSGHFFLDSDHVIVATLKERSLMIFKLVKNTEGKLKNLDLLEKILFDTRIRDLLIINNKLVISMEDQVELVTLSR